LVKKNQSFLGAALSLAGQPSSKRLLAFASFLCSICVVIIDIMAYPDSEMGHYFDGFLMFAGACLSITGIEHFKNGKNSG